MTILVKVRTPATVQPPGRVGPLAAANSNVVVHVPDRCLVRDRIVKEKIWPGVAVEICDRALTERSGHNRCLLHH